MTFSHPLLLLLLLALPAAGVGWWLVRRRRMRYAVVFTNVEVLASLVPARSRRRHVPAALLLLALAALCVAVARPHVTRAVASDRAAVILVLDVSGSMQAEDVKPTRLAAAQRALHTFLAKVPKRVRVGLVLFAGEPVVATPPTDDHELVGEAVDDAAMIDAYSGTAIGDALETAVQLGQEITGGGGGVTALGGRSLAAYRPVAARAPSPLVSILFLSDGAQTRGFLAPAQGAQLAKQAGFPVYTVSLGTTGNTTLRGSSGGFFGGGGGGFGFGGRGLTPDPATLRAIARTTGGQFFRAKTAGAVEAAYSKLGSSLGRAPGKVEITDELVGAAAVLLVLAGLASMLVAPRLP
ncbi:MAG TPA: VWA domain-containing protein [Gaiellaceae bacterium]|nr:VWA domain-containing protein [Gaiellaceae bacterium]